MRLFFKTFLIVLTVEEEKEKNPNIGATLFVRFCKILSAIRHLRTYLRKTRKLLLPNTVYALQIRGNKKFLM